MHRTNVMGIGNAEFAKQAFFYDFRKVIFGRNFLKKISIFFLKH